ncbi:carbon-nitrogen hydrolase family protein [Candidatus Poribacteria bacterium]|jgi:predicted amidohydrolase|nr:carbon-nitrogen hydrolase family protein [Candidatus Poribacteria bacterium]MBT5535115.1 carbon-nitrogen hydrolase family protein [Candidatus Poribacteria bacterium]MBT5710295.1 carbon-nitrogen hydrolase family protein [Candidatus Poribacteria bacterium]MBT7096935.1 carbon-nitrogen hydrolase family protein [Candidatus Poribacteria bacterium]MBT7806034.1 carbon-nitrogen hydrolase family protein [Candidatus Poribacteria bacterium]
MGNVRVAMAQILVEGGAPDANLARAVARIMEAGAEGCDVVVLPECLDLAWTHPSARTSADPIPGARSGVLAGAAREARVHVVAGLTEGDGDHVRNTSLLISPAGDILLKHSKINLLDIARDVYEPGTSLSVAATPFGVVGIPICADNFGGCLHYSRALIGMGADIILSPCAWAVPPSFDDDETPYGGLWLDAYGTLARESGVPVVGVSNVGRMTGGPWDGHDCIGRSLAIGRDGEVAAHLPFGVDAECLRVVTL